jgi:hypothetical protein
VALLPQCSLSYPKKENRQARKKIRNLNRFEYRYLNGLKVPCYYSYPPLSIKVTSLGMTLFPSMARLTLPYMNKQKLDPKDSTYNSLGCEVEKKDQR